MRRVRLGEIGRVITGRTPPTRRREFFGLAYPFITPTDIGDDCRHIATERFLSEEGRRSQESLLLPPDAVSFVCIGATIGKICMTDRLSFTNQQINSIIVDRARHDSRFIFYKLKSVAEEIRARASGAATPIVNKSSFSDFEIDVPNLDLQHRIASILSAYDDLIENNERRIAILEEMARRLYEEWFTHFRFPDHRAVRLVESDIGPIPETWSVSTVDETFEIIGGGTPSKDIREYWDGGTINWYTPSDLTAANSIFMDVSGMRITEEGLNRSAARLFPPWCVMMTSRATLGIVAINTTSASTNQGFITCVPNSRFPLYFLFHWLKANATDFEAIGTGATFKEITKGAFKKLRLSVPPTDLVSRFENLVEPMMLQALNLQRQIALLRSVRDLLLRRLVSGEVNVGAAPIPTDVVAA